MPLDPFLVPLLAHLPPFPDHIDDFGAWREADNAAADALVHRIAEPGPQVAAVTDAMIAVDGGEIKARMYRPFGEGPHPGHLYLHGGGWIGGTIDAEVIDIIARERCVGAQCVVVTADYRKAPEHPYPTGLNDSYAALLWLAEHAEGYGIRRDLITVGGGSAGANLAAALTIKVREQGGPAIAFQLLEVPALDLTLQSSSCTDYASGYGLTYGTLSRVVEYYLPDGESARHQYASPLLAPDVSDLPPAYIMSAEYDPVRGDGERYTQRLQTAGVHATFSLQAGQIHISPALTKVMPAARAWRDEAIGALNEAHSGRTALNFSDIPST